MKLSDKWLELSGDLQSRYASPSPSAEVAGTPFAYDDRNVLAKWLFPTPPTMLTHDPSMWPQRMGIPSESDEYWATAEGSPWKRTWGQNALMKVNEALNTPTGIVLSNFLGPAVGRIPKPVMAPSGTGGGGTSKGIRAYHGSPHDFDRFDMSKIGTGEGAQAYGHGLYFAEAEGVAKSYRDTLSANSPQTVGNAIGAKLLATYGGDSAAAVADIKSRPNWQVNQSFRDAVKYLEGDGAAPAGRVYEVNINADPERFLDWDKPLSQQSEPVRKSLEGMGSTNLSYELAKDRPTGLSVLNAIRNDTGKGMDVASARLRESGIPGIRYKDSGSRGAEGGTHNYVVFDDKLIEILRKYGIAGLLAGGASFASGATNDNPMAAASAGRVLRGGSSIRGYHGGARFAAERLVRHPDGREEFVVGGVDKLPDVPSGATVVKDYPLGRFRDEEAFKRGVIQGRGHYITESPDLVNEYYEPGGARYEVSVNADPRNFLMMHNMDNLDGGFPPTLTMADQPPHIIEALKRAGVYDPRRTIEDFADKSIDTPAQQRALREQGIAGVRYADDPPGVINSVVFDGSVIDILRRYGLAGLLAGGGLVAGQSAPDAQPAR